MCVMFEPRAGETGWDVRQAARAGFAGLTVGRAPGYEQANLILLPAEAASEFEAFCRANAAACPLLAIGEPGDYSLDALGRDIDLRVDLPAYLVHQSGSALAVGEIASFWRRDLVAFAIGCWFGAEAALQRAGIRLRHVELGIQGPLFRTSRPAISSGRFSGPLVVSMRPFAKTDVAEVAAITSRSPRSHGAPLDVRGPGELGLDVTSPPDWGEPLAPEPGEAALFWPCGLTALAALKNADLPFFITHAPGAMLVTDLNIEAAA